MTTQQQFEQAIALCREVFMKKMYDYGTALQIRFTLKQIVSVLYKPKVLPK